MLHTESIFIVIRVMTVTKVPDQLPHNRTTEGNSQEIKVCKYQKYYWKPVFGTGLGH